jgi:SAM-dependent methyltransferase
VSASKPRSTGLVSAMESKDSVCPGCGKRGLFVFCEQEGIPVNSCVLMPDRERALGCARGKMELALCEGCGLIVNAAFDPRTQDFSQGYEGTQAFSACFSEFARSLGQRLIDKYDIRGKRILEVGCGNGEFLSLMCEAGGNEGIGFDPAYVGSGTERKARMEFVRDYYSDAYGDVEADVVCCRHTLEHVADVAGFLGTIRRGIGDRRDVLVFFEVPSGERVIREGAFWDVYYEHCNYFTAETLRGLFEGAGFEPDEVYSDYGGQYLILTARPAEPGKSNAAHSVLGREDLQRFVRKAEERIGGWNALLGQMREGGMRVVTWGSSSNCVSFLTTVEASGVVEHVVDINPRKQCMYMPGTCQRIVGPESLVELRPGKVIVINPMYVDEIGKELERLGVKAEMLPITSIQERTV